MPRYEYRLIYKKCIRGKNIGGIFRALIGREECKYFPLSPEKN